MDIHMILYLNADKIVSARPFELSIWAAVHVNIRVVVDGVFYPSITQNFDRSIQKRLLFFSSNKKRVIRLRLSEYWTCRCVNVLYYVTSQTYLILDFYQHSRLTSEAQILEGVRRVDHLYVETLAGARPWVGLSLLHAALCERIGREGFGKIAGIVGPVYKPEYQKKLRLSFHEGGNQNSNDED